MDKDLTHKISDFLNKRAVEKAWLFGSYSRKEETNDSDIDLLIKFSSDKKITLFYYLQLKYELEQLTGKSIDLVEEGQLKKFAVKTFNKDKTLIYERRDKERLNHIVEATNNIFEFTKDLTFEEFNNNKMMKFAVIKNSEIIGEAANLLTKELKTKNPEIQWYAIVGLRHVLVHGYYQISDTII